MWNFSLFLVCGGAFGRRWRQRGKSKEGEGCLAVLCCVVQPVLYERVNKSKVGVCESDQLQERRNTKLKQPENVKYASSVFPTV